MSSTATREGDRRFGQLAVACLERAQRLLSVVSRIHVEHHQAARGAGGDCNTGIGTGAPPCLDRRPVDGGIVHAMERRGPLRARTQWEDVPSTARKAPGSFERGGGNGSRQEHHLWTRCHSLSGASVKSALFSRR